MRKIKLELESLTIESFDTASFGGERGTMLAQSLTPTVAVPCGETSLQPICPAP